MKQLSTELQTDWVQMFMKQVDKMGYVMTLRPKDSLDGYSPDESDDRESELKHFFKIVCLRCILFDIAATKKRSHTPEDSITNSPKK